MFINKYLSAKSYKLKVVSDSDEFSKRETTYPNRAHED